VALALVQGGDQAVHVVAKLERDPWIGVELKKVWVGLRAGLRARLRVRARVRVGVRACTAELVRVRAKG
jgi:hypothetical protein